MSMSTYEGIVEKGHIRLLHHNRLPDKTRVYVIVPDIREPVRSTIISPRLRNATQLADFHMEVLEDAQA